MGKGSPLEWIEASERQAEGSKGTNRAQAPATETLAQALATAQTQEGSNLRVSRPPPCTSEKRTWTGESLASSSLGPWETPKGIVAPGHLFGACVALPCSSSLSTGVLDATVGRGRGEAEGGKSGSRNLQPTPDPVGEAKERFPHLATLYTHCPSSLLLAHIPTAKAITAGARETF